VSAHPGKQRAAGVSLDVDRTSPVPLYFQVATRLQELIETGDLPVGTRIENEIDLAGRLGVSRPTARRAIQYLVERGMLVRKRGVGTQVVNPKLRRPIALSSLYDDLVKAGRAPRTEVRRCEVLPASDAVVRALGLREGAEVTVLERLRYADDDRLAIMTNAVPVEVIRPRPEDLAEHGLYDLLRRAGHAPSIATQVIGARPATAAEARVLGDRRGAPLLTMTRTAWDASGRGVEWGSHLYRAELYSFHLTIAGG
jgi:DNA-binding GntR family transcriptional regulator